MLVIKGGISRNIDERQLHVYKGKGYEAVEESADEGSSKTEKTIDQMTVPELTAYATEKGIDLTGITVKADILAKIKEVEGGAQ